MWHHLQTPKNIIPQNIIHPLKNLRYEKLEVFKSASENHDITRHEKRRWKDVPEKCSSLSKRNQSSAASDDVKSSVDEWKIC